jgi:hypothetical protein
VLVSTIANDGANNPVFNTGISDTRYLGTSGITVDDIRTYDTTFTIAQQCTQVGWQHGRPHASLAW